MLGNLRSSIEGLLRSMVWNEWFATRRIVLVVCFQKGVKKKKCVY